MDSWCPFSSTVKGSVNEIDELISKIKCHAHRVESWQLELQKMFLVMNQYLDERGPLSQYTDTQLKFTPGRNPLPPQYDEPDLSGPTTECDRTELNFNFDANNTGQCTPSVPNSSNSSAHGKDHSVGIDLEQNLEFDEEITGSFDPNNEPNVDNQPTLVKLVRVSTRIKKYPGPTVTPITVQYPVKKKVPRQFASDNARMRIYDLPVSVAVNFDPVLSKLEPRKSEILTDGKYNPFAPYDSHCVTDVRNWYHRYRTKTISVRVPLYDGPDTVDADWVGALISCRGWLSSSNIDIAMHIVLMKFKKWPSMFCHGWTHVKCSFWAIVNKQQEGWERYLMRGRDWVWESMCNYAFKCVSGSEPKNGRMVPWSQVSNVYGVANTRRSHWVFYNIQPRMRKIVAYDPLCTSMKQWAHEGEFSIFAKLVGSLLGGGPLTVELYSDTPRQGNGFDCGVMCIKFFECFISGNPLSDVNPSMTMKYRESICCDVFRVSTLCSNTVIG